MMLPLRPFPLPDVWRGHTSTWDGTNLLRIGLTTVDDIDEVIASGVEPSSDTSGIVAAVLRLRDGRYISYQTYYNRTCDGFRETAYGGGVADLIVSSTLRTAALTGLTDIGRSLCGFPEDWGHSG